MKAARQSILTIGHSNHSIASFLALLKGNQACGVADVRSSPYSSRFPQFSREALKLALEVAGIDYVFLGGELGGRSSNKECYVNGRVLYRRLAATDEFRCGIRRLLKEHEKGITIVMCAEREPLDCHRSLLVARELVRTTDIEVAHIHADGSVEQHSEAERRLMSLWGIELSQGVLFRTEPDPLDEAYAKQEARVAFTSPDFGQLEDRVPS